LQNLPLNRYFLMTLNILREKGKEKKKGRKNNFGIPPQRKSTPPASKKGGGMTREIWKKNSPPLLSQSCRNSRQTKGRKRKKREVQFGQDVQPSFCPPAKKCGLGKKKKEKGGGYVSIPLYSTGAGEKGRKKKGGGEEEPEKTLFLALISGEKKGKGVASRLFRFWELDGGRERPSSFTFLRAISAAPKKKGGERRKRKKSTAGLPAGRNIAETERKREKREKKRGPN